MTTGATGQLGLALPVQGELSGTWGDTVNNGTTQYTNIAIAATLTLTNDGAVTLANTAGDASASNIVSTLTGAGTVTAQFAIVRVTGTLTTAKVVTAPSYSKTYVVVNAATGGIVTFKASGQTGVSIAVGESAWVYFNGTDYVKLAGTVNTGVTSFQTSLSGLTPSTSTTGAVTLAGTLGTANGGTGLTSFTSGGVVYASSTSALATGSALVFDGTNLGIGSSPAYKLDVAGQFARIGQSGGAGAGLILAGASATKNWVIANQYNVSGALEFTQTTATGGSTISGTPSMILSASENLGLGVTPSAWGNGLKAIQVGSLSGISMMGYSGAAEFGNNFYYDTDYRYGANASASLYVMNAGKHTWSTAASGTAGNAISFTQAMTLDSSGRLLLGTTSVASAERAIIAFDSAGSISQALSTKDTNASASGNSHIILRQSNDVYLGALGRSGTDTAMFVDGNAYLALKTGSTERARLNAGFSVGTTADPGAGAIYATGNITAYYSDARLKTVSGKIENALDKVAQLSGVYYTNNSVAKSFGYDSDEVQVGVLAQDVEAVLPQIVKAAPFDLDEHGNSKSGENYKTVQYERLVPLLIEAINELRAEVKALKGV